MFFHLTTTDAWASAQAAGAYCPSSLKTEGFIHLSTQAQWPVTRARFFSGQAGLVLLVIDPQRLAGEVRFEPADGEHFPHLYGALNLEAVLEVQVLS